MAKKTVVTYIDDVDGTEASETIQFGIDGKLHEIDLSDANAEELRSLLSPWIEQGRRVSNRPAPRSRGKKDYDPAKVRDWARSHGLRVGDRGDRKSVV